MKTASPAKTNTPPAKGPFFTSKNQENSRLSQKPFFSPASHPMLQMDKPIKAKEEEEELPQIDTKIPFNTIRNSNPALYEKLKLSSQLGMDGVPRLMRAFSVEDGDKTQVNYRFFLEVHMEYSKEGHKGTGGTTYMKKPKSVTEKGKAYQDYHIVVFIDPESFKKDPKISNQADLVKVWLHGLNRILLHELVHVAILLDQKTAELTANKKIIADAGSLDPTEAFRIYKAMIAKANLSKEKKEIQDYFIDLGLDKGMTTGIGALGKKELETLINEKIAFYISSQSFGNKPPIAISDKSPAFISTKSNAEIALLYSRIAIKRFIKKGTGKRIPSADLYGVSSPLISKTTILFDAMDAQLAQKASPTETETDPDLDDK